MTLRMSDLEAMDRHYRAWRREIVETIAREFLDGTPEPEALADRVMDAYENNQYVLRLARAIEQGQACAEREIGKLAPAVRNLLQSLENLSNAGGVALVERLEENGVDPDRLVEELETLKHLTAADRERKRPGNIKRDPALAILRAAAVLMNAGIARQPAARIVARLTELCGPEPKTWRSIEQAIKNNDG